MDIRAELLSDHRDLGAYEIFTRLPSVRSIKGYNTRSRPVYSSWPKSDVTEVETMEFSNSLISGRNLVRIISRTKSLRKFKYEHAFSSWERYSRFDPLRIVSALLNRASDTLTNLDLTSLQLHGGAVKNLNYRIWPLQNFKVLTTIRTNAEMFPVEFAKKKIIEQLRHTPWFCVQLARNYFLHDVLPKSTETLILAVTDQSPKKAMSLILKGLHWYKERFLPNLKNIIFETDDPLEENEKSLCKSLGITVKAWESEDSRRMVEL